MTSTFQVDLAQYSGPLDLLMHIVRREEIDLADVPLARIVDQYFGYLEVLVDLQIDDVADFLEIASVLLEWKSKHAIPSQEPSVLGVDGELPVNEQAHDLVERLIEFKQFRDASIQLEDSSRRWQLRYPRLADGILPNRTETGHLQIEPIEIWDLVSAFGRILRDHRPSTSAQIIYDETPIQAYMTKIHRLLSHTERVELTSLFEPGMHKSAVVGMFLATLELTRHYGVVASQSDSCQPLYLAAGQGFEPSVEFMSKMVDSTG